MTLGELIRRISGELLILSIEMPDGAVHTASLVDECGNLTLVGGQRPVDAAVEGATPDEARASLAEMLRGKDLFYSQRSNFRGISRTRVPDNLSA